MPPPAMMSIMIWSQLMSEALSKDGDLYFLQIELIVLLAIRYYASFRESSLILLPTQLRAYFNSIPSFFVDQLSCIDRLVTFKMMVILCVQLIGRATARFFAIYPTPTLCTPTTHISSLLHTACGPYPRVQDL